MAHNQKYGDRTVLLPDVGRLQPGDIVLSLNAESTDRKSGKIAGVITMATKGRFSHALICSKPPTLIEAIGHGVSTLSLARCFAHSFDNVRVLRYPDAAVARQAAELAQIEVGRDYSKSQAMRSVFPLKTLDKLDDPGIFCSALVAQVYVAAGAEPFTRTPVDKTTPATLDRMDGLSDVTREIFYEALAPNNIETMTALDGDAAPTPSAPQTEIANRYAKATAPLASQISADYFGGDVELTPTYYGVTQFIVHAFDALSSVKLGQQSNALAAIRELDRTLCELIESGEFATLLSEIEQIDGADLQRAMQRSFDADPDIDVRAMEGALQTTISQLEERRLSMKNLDEWNQGRSRALSAYLALEGRTITFYEKREVLYREILDRIP